MTAEQPMTCPHTSPPGPHVVSDGECSNCGQPVADSEIARRPMLPGKAWYVGTRDDAEMVDVVVRREER